MCALAFALALLGAPAFAQAPFDVDGDGRVDIYTDLVYVARYLLGLDPVPESFRATGTPIPSNEVIRARIEAAAGTPRPTDTAVATPTQTATATATATTAVANTVAAGSPTVTRTATRTRPPGSPTRTPTSSPTFSIPEGSDVVRAAAEISVQNAETFTMIDLGCVSAGCRSSAPAGARMAAGPRSALRAGAVGGTAGLAQACAGGGTRTETCALGVQSITYDDCIEPGADGHTNRRDGRTVLTVSDTNFCDTMIVDPLETVVLELRDYRHVEFDAQSVEVARLEADWIDTLSPRRLGCRLAADDRQLVDGEQEVRGTIRLACKPGALELPCRRGTTDVTLTTASLQLSRDSGGFPCELGLRVKGQLQVLDRDRGLGGQQCVASFTQTFEERLNPDSGALERFLIAEAPADDGTSTVRQEGRMTVDAFGPLELRTQRQEIGDGTPAPGSSEQPASVQFVDGSDCPVGGSGEIEVRRPPLIDMQASAPSGGAAGAPASEFRQRLYRATNGQVYQVLQNVDDLSSFGSDALQITTLAASEAGSVGQCAFTAGAEALPQAVAAVERTRPFPTDRIFKSALIPFADEPTWNRNGGQSQGGATNDGAVCIGPDCQANAVCPQGGQCVSFTIGGADSTSITQATGNAFGGIPAASLVPVPSISSAVGCRDLGNVSTIAFGTDRPTIEIAQCSSFLPPPGRDGFRLPNGYSLVIAYQASFSSLFNAAVAGFPIDVDNNQIVCPAGPAPRVLHLGESELGSVEAPTFRFQEGAGGVPQIVFDFLGGDPQGMQTVSGCVGISRLTTCQ